MIVALYTDAGCAGRNPAPAITWAFCAVDENNELVYKESGVVEAPAGRTLTNNFAELCAAIKALEYVGNDWSGTLFTDSAVTQGRISSNWALKNIPPNMVRRLNAVVKRSGKLETVLVQGHPTKAELKTGIGRNGDPVSIWNVKCDQLCNVQSKSWKEQQLKEKAKLIADAS